MCGRAEQDVIDKAGGFTLLRGALSAYATIMGLPLSTLFKKLMEERLEDAFNFKIAEDFSDQQARSEVETRPIDALNVGHSKDIYK